jgi:hypothetical protein
VILRPEPKASTFAKPLPMAGQTDSYARFPRVRFPAAESAPVAQLDRAPDYESGGQEFESLRARHHFLIFDSKSLRDFFAF